MGFALLDCRRLALVSNDREGLVAGGRPQVAARVLARCQAAQLVRPREVERHGMHGVPASRARPFGARTLSAASHIVV